MAFTNGAGIAAIESSANTCELGRAVSGGIVPIVMPIGSNMGRREGGEERWGGEDTESNLMPN